MSATAEIVNALAATHGVTSRAVRKWRDNGDARWTEYIASQSPQQKADRAERKQGRKVGSMLELPGIRTQLACIEIECNTLVKMLQPDDDGNMPNIDTVATLSRILDTKRDTWRKLAKDVPPIENEDGSSIPLDAVTKYCVEIRGLIETLPARIASIMPQEVALETKGKVSDEVNKVLELIAAVELTQGGDNE